MGMASAEVDIIIIQRWEESDFTFFDKWQLYPNMNGKELVPMKYILDKFTYSSTTTYF